MELQKYKLGAYNLNVIKTTNFKTIRVEVKFRNYIKKDEITIRNLLKMVLIDSTKNYNTEKKLVIESENLYDLKISSTNNRVGNFTTLSFNMTYLNEKYTEVGMQEESLNFLLEILFNPNIVNNKFNTLSFNNCKNKLAKSIISRKDDKTKYSIMSLLKNMGDEPYSYDPYGYMDDLNNINEQSLYDYYKKMLENDCVDIYIIGDVESDKIKKYFIENFKINTYKKEKTGVLGEEVLPRKRAKKIHEFDNVSQTKLVMGLRLNNLSDYERKYALPIYNEILGGSGNSLLFNCVREQYSLAYYINSIIQPYDNLLIIYSGVDEKQTDLAIKLIKKTLKDMKNNAFSNSSLENAISLISSSLLIYMDKQSSIINNYYAVDILDSDNLETRLKKFAKVNREDILNIAKKISLDTIFLLENNNEIKTN